ANGEHVVLDRVYDVADSRMVSVSGLVIWNSSVEPEAATTWFPSEAAARATPPPAPAAAPIAAPSPPPTIAPMPAPSSAPPAIFFAGPFPFAVRRTSLV